MLPRGEWGGVFSITGTARTVAPSLLSVKGLMTTIDLCISDLKEQGLALWMLVVTITIVLLPYR